MRALSRAGVAAEVGPLIDAHGDGRRRATFHARFVDGREQVGFMRARAHDIIAVDACPLFAPGLAGAIAAANALAAAVRGISKPLDIQATATLGGLDFDLRGSGAPDDLTRRKLAAAAERLDLARLVRPRRDNRRAPAAARSRSATCWRSPPPGGFLQATEAGERALADGAAAALHGRQAGRRSLLRRRRLRAAAGARARGLRRRFRRGGGRGADARRRRGDRTCAPSTPRPATSSAGRWPAPSSRAFDAVLFDPPRAGAEAQARALAAAGPPLVVAVSCNADSFARDARILIGGGYAIGPVTALDQFRFSPHVEILAAFRRRPVKRRKGVLG